MHNKPNPDQDPKQLVTDARKQITRSAIFAVSALVVIVIACYAWFVSAGSVSGIISPVVMSGSMFELASNGDGYGGFLNADDFPDAYKNVYKELNGDPVESDPNFESTGLKHTVLWRLNDSSNLGYYGSNNGIYPGSKGQLDFSVIPKNNGNLKLKFRLELLPLMSDVDNDSEETVEQRIETLENLLKGHFLFYYQEEPEGEKTWVQCNSGEFVLDFGQRKEDTPIPVSLNWRWPLLLEHISNETGIRAQIPEYASYFFYPKDQIPENIEASLDSPQMSNLFNNADQYIGKNLNWVVVRLTAQLAE